MEYKYLDQVNSPQDLHRFDYRELELLCGDIREFLIEKVSQTGGHLSSNLGVIELTVALHRYLRTPQDIILFDVGHQCYTHKLLTGRREGFDKLRQKGGIAGFPNPQESEHDAFIAGHGSPAISTAIGMARAKKLKNEPGLVVVIVGDGAFTGGMAYEGINNVDHLDNLVIILNDNTMSISKNVGALAHYLNTLRTHPQYYQAKKDVKSILDSTPVIGGGVVKGIQFMKAALRKGLYHSTFFEELGLRYVGPVDGHDLPGLCSLFSSIRQITKPLLIHVDTKKGKGFKPAERNPGAFHGVSTFDANHITDPDNSPGDSFSTAFGKALVREADKNPRICAVTAAMKYGTGLQYFKKAHLNRFFDVGMAEEHAVTYSAGLAAGGMTPVVAIYSTFMQRAYDQWIHDVMLSRQNVLLAVDRAGFVPGDGETHQGIYDASFLSQHPDLTVVSPANYNEVDWWMHRLLAEETGPRVIRYPRGGEPQALAGKACTGQAFDVLVESKKADLAMVSYGIEITEVLAAAEALKKDKVDTDVVKMTVINPIEEELVQKLLVYPAVMFAEEGVRQGGIGEHLALRLMEAGYQGRFVLQAVEQNRLDHANVGQLRQDTGLDAESLRAKALEAVKAAATGRKRRK